MQIHDKYRLLSAKNIVPLLAKIREFGEIYPQKPHAYTYQNGIHIDICADVLTRDFTKSPKQNLASPQNLHNALESLALDLRSWRKGPFFLGDLHIDSEWQSFVKWDLLRPHIGNLLENAVVGDIGCNNGFYLFAMSLHSPRLLVGFDPSALFFCQFRFINHFLDLPISYELLGVQDLGEYLKSDALASLAKTHLPKSSAKIAKFDVLFCLGVLYHRSDVFATLKSLASALDSGGVAFVDTLIVEMQDFLDESFLKDLDEKMGKDIAKKTLNHIISSLANTEFVLCPKKSYAKMRNVFFIPSVRAFEEWAQRCGFGEVELLEIMPTTTEEQRHTKWITSLSLESFLDKNDSTRTIEGYPAPKRAYFKLRRK